MSIGNLRDQGNKGNNFPYQLKNLQVLAQILTAGGVSNALLTQILSALQAGQEYEAALVVDSANVTWLEVRVWNTVTHAFDPPVYYAPGSNTTGTPTGAITYINPNTYLATIVSSLTAVTRTPSVLRTSAAGTIAAGARSISVYNAGSAAGSILGGSNNILAGEVFNFDAGAQGDTLSAFAYDGTGTTLVITKIV